MPNAMATKIAPPMTLPMVAGIRFLTRNVPTEMGAPSRMARGMTNMLAMLCSYLQGDNQAAVVSTADQSHQPTSTALGESQQAPAAALTL